MGLIPCPKQYARRDAMSGKNAKYLLSLPVRIGAWLLGQLGTPDIKNIAGAVKKQLDPIEEKIDHIQEKLDDIGSRLRKIEQRMAVV